MKGNNERGDVPMKSGRRTVSKKKAAGSKANKKMRFVSSFKSDRKKA